MFLSGESQGRGSLVGCRLWGLTESDMTEATSQCFVSSTNFSQRQLGLFFNVTSTGKKKKNFYLKRICVRTQRNNLLFFFSIQSYHWERERGVLSGTFPWSAPAKPRDPDPSLQWSWVIFTELQGRVFSILSWKWQKTKQNKTKHTHINSHTHKNSHFFIFVSRWKMYIRITFGDVVQTFLFLELLGDFDKYPNMSNSLPDNTLYVSKYCK